MTQAEKDLIEEAFAYFRWRYVRELVARLNEKFNEGELDEVVDTSGIIAGDLLTGVDQTAYSETQSEYGWRIGSEELSAAFQEAGPDVYDGIDYEAIISQVRETREEGP